MSSRSGPQAFALCFLAALGAPPSFPAPATPPPAATLRAPGFLLPEPMALQPFELVDESGGAFTPRALQGRWTLLFFGYTHCPDVCPATLAQIRAVKGAMATQEPTVPLAVVFVSIDPARDGSEQLDQYTKMFGTDFLGVGGPQAAVDAFAKQFRVKYAVSSGTPEAYLIDHTSSVALITPQGQLKALFSVPLRTDAVAADIDQLMRSGAREGG